MKKMLSLVMALALVLSCLCLPASAEVAYTTSLRVEVFDRSIAGLNIEDCWQLHYAQKNFGDPNGIKIWYVATNGEIQSFDAVFVPNEGSTTEGYVTFSTNHFSYYAVAYEETQEAKCRRRTCR